MGRKQGQQKGNNLRDYRHTHARRKNNPPAGIAPTYEVQERKTRSYSYDPHLDPQLIWAGKAEHTSFEVDVVSLHIHERISTAAILRAVRRPEPKQFELFGETPLPADKEAQFYQHEVGWANRLILGDSLLVMNSLLVKEGMAGKVQMIYFDPPYGIKYSSNFQPRIDKRDVKDRDEDLTHEPEQIKAYRDTWRLGIHSYLTYLRDRLLLCRELLHESGSIFLQINDENLHLARCLLDEVFGRENFVAVIAFKKTGGFPSRFLASIYDYLLWYAKDKSQTKYRRLYLTKTEAGTIEQYRHIDGEGRVFEPTSLLSEGATTSGSFAFEYRGRIFQAPPNSHWKTSPEGLKRLVKAERIWHSRDTLRYKRYLDDFPVAPLVNVWDDTMGEREMLYAVQTNTKVVERCILMTTDPGDLVFDPTCVRKGTGVLVCQMQASQNSPLLSPSSFPTLSLPASGEFFPTPSLPASGEGMGGAETFPASKEGKGETETLPASGEGKGGAVYLVPIETIKPGDWVLGHDGLPHRVLRVISRYYRGTMIGLRHEKSDKMLWITADHKVLAKLRPRSLGGNLDWSGIPKHLRGRSRELRKEMTPPERKLWQALRNRQMQFKFRRQHPIGPYIADFYSREARLVVEVNGSDFHSTDEAIARDRMRDEYLQSLGLRVLRFPATEVERNLEGVLETIWRVCQEQFSVEGAQWVEARDLAIGDLVFFGPEREGVRIVEIRSEYTEEIVYDLEVEGVHSFITEVCVVHNCGSGTTAYCAEKWGRRWITCDTSRVAIAIARQRLMTAKFDYYELRDPKRGPVGGFIYETVPHITLESIARNTEIDNIAAKYQPQIDQALKDLNEALGTNWQEWEVPREIPHSAWSDEACEIYWKLYQAKNQALQHDPRQVEELLEAIYRLTGYLWKSLKDVPDPIPPSNWSDEAKASLKRFWELKRKKRKEIDDSIKRIASQETLYDRPKVNRSVVRVSGPFTVEAIPVPTIEDPTQAPVPQFEEEEMKARISDRGGDHLTNMLNLLKQQGGVIFPGGKKMELENIRPINLGFLHAEAETKQNGKALRVAISFGPQYGPVTAFQVQEAIPTAKVNGYQVLIFAGFSFDPEAQALIQRTPVAGLQIQLVNIAPDVLVGDLLKATRTSQIFTAFGQPDVRVERQNDGTYIVELLGVDIYDPLTGEVRSTRGEDVAAWFLDTDYDGKTFHICQAFFPNDQNAWEKLQRALKAYIDPEIFERMRGTVSFPFQLGEHKRIAVKVIDFRGNEVVRVIALERTSY